MRQSHDHHHGHSHGHDSSGSIKRLRLSLLLTATLLAAEVVGGLLSNSVALLADAGHMLTDVGALGLSLFVAWFAQHASTPQKTYGYLRWEILAAFLNGAMLLLISVWIMWESVFRLRNPEPIEGGLMLWIALAGLVVNMVSARILHGAATESVNVRGAYLHVIGDMLASVGTVAAAIVIHYTGWLAADPIASFVTTALIIRGAWKLVREAVDILLESTPEHIPVDAVRKQLEAIPRVESVHDLHVWALTPQMIAMSVHAVVRDASAHQHVLEHIHDAMRLFGIEHVTAQLECEGMQLREAQGHR
ncbi:MAG: cation transporter [Gemmatimonadaceae bacterium]|nr:cation transporter [Gemmatimonadaceae bacterium]MBA3655955.1 cation transporter [Gemmatimonadaceae bacterium]